MKLKKEIDQILFENIVVPTGFAALICALILGFFFKVRSDIRWVEHSEGVIAKISALQKGFLESQAGARGYLLTGRGAFLGPYSQFRENMVSRIEELSDLVKDNPPQQMRARELLSAARSWSLATDNLITRFSINRAEARKLFNEGNIDSNGVELRRRTQTMLDDEYRLRKERAEEFEFFALVSTLFIAPVFLLGSAVVAFRGHRSIRRISDLYEVPLQKNAEQMASLEKQAWLQETESKLTVSILGSLTRKEFSENLVQFLCEQLGALAGACFLKNDTSENTFRRWAAIGLKSDTEDTLSAENSIVAQAVRSLKPIFLTGFSQQTWNLKSALGEHLPQLILCAPIVQGKDCIGFVELAFNERPSDRLLEFFNISSGHIAAIAIGVISREALAENGSLLREKTDLLRAQQEALRVSNDELEYRAALLRESQTRLEENNAELERQARELKQASQHKSRFLANMSHELRTPITSLIGYSELLRPVVKEWPLASKYVGVLLDNGRHLLDLVNEVLDLSKIEAGQLDVESEPLELTPMLENVATTLAPLARKNDTQLELKPSDFSGTYVMADPRRFRQILINLLNNAIKFTPNGKVTLVMGETNREKGILSLLIKDTGCGISEEARERLFEPFAQDTFAPSSTQEGTGLGLSISRHLARLQGGDIRLEKTSAEEGSIFSITMPLATADTARTRVLYEGGEELLNADSLENLRIFLVDDSPDNRLLVSTVLEQLGAKVEACEDGETALARLSRAQNKYDILLVDYRMPGMDGLEVIRRLRSAGDDRPIIMLTANAMKGEKGAAFAAGATAYVSKPIDWEQLVWQIRRHTPQLNSPTNAKVLAQSVSHSSEVQRAT